jgi:hypothetical protein
MRRGVCSSTALVAALLLLAPVARAQRTPESQSPVVQMLRLSPDARTRAQAALTLARLPSPDAPDALRVALGDRAAVVRAAAAVTLADLNDAASIAALRAHASDPDANVRDAIARALGRLETPAATATFEPVVPLDLARVRFLVRPGELADRERGDATRGEQLRVAVRAALRNRGTVALHPGVLPPAASRRLRAGSLRQFTLDGGLQTVRRVPAPGGERLRVEVSLVIVAEPQHAIVGMVTGAASLPAPLGGDPQAQRRTEATLISSAVQAALRDLETSLAQIP